MVTITVTDDMDEPPTINVMDEDPTTAGTYRSADFAEGQRGLQMPMTR